MLDSVKRAMELQTMAGITRQTAAAALKQYGNDVHRTLLAMIEAGEITLADLHPEACPPQIVAAAQTRAGRQQRAEPAIVTRAAGLCSLSRSDGDTWEGHDVFLYWKDFYVARERGRRRQDDREEAARQGQVLVSVRGTAGQTSADGWGEPQRRAYLFLKENETAVGQAVMEALLRFYRNEVIARREDWVTTRMSPVELERRLPSIGSTAELGQMVSLDAVFVWGRARDGVAYTGFQFACAWDEEHGAGVVTYRDHVIAIGDASTAFDEESLDDGG